jgi:leucyl-tRNA synthetase
VQGTGKEEELLSFRAEVGRMSEIDRVSTEREKKGMPTGRSVINPVTGEAIPIWLADYVLMDYGTGAIMAVPAHDERDFDFARTFDLPIKVVIAGEGTPSDVAEMTEAFSGSGVMVSSGDFDGTPTSESVEVVTRWLDEQGLGRAAKNFRLRDWLISRQRYWGTPIPIVFCDDCGEVPVPDDQLPLVLPDEVDLAPPDGVSPLATASDWVNTTCPRCGAAARRETDTMDTFVDSSWYFLRYLDPHNESAPFDPAKVAAWMPIDQYTGGITHAVMHLIYARFIEKVLMDMGMLKDPEPFPACLNQGMVTMGGKAMSKSRGNIVEPQEAFRRYGADALRLYMLFSGPPEQDFDWPSEGVSAIGRVTAPWLMRVWRLCEDVNALGGGSAEDGEAENTLRKLLHKTIKVATRDYEAFAFNTAIARMQELVNATYRYRASGGANGKLLKEVVLNLLKMLAPMAPFLAEEQWASLGENGSVHDVDWPGFDAALARDDEVMMVVQVNGKVRDTIAVSSDVTEEEMRAAAFASEKIKTYMGDLEPLKVIVRPPKLISLVLPKS